VTIAQYLPSRSREGTGRVGNRERVEQTGISNDPPVQVIKPPQELSV